MRGAHTWQPQLRPTLLKAHTAPWLPPVEAVDVRRQYDDVVRPQFPLHPSDRPVFSRESVRGCTSYGTCLDSVPALGPCGTCPAHPVTPSAPCISHLPTLSLPPVDPVHTNTRAAHPGDFPVFPLCLRFW
ncbi:hypothetical protein LIA77_08662 [Sarocladium implicatum]|nr:hypothetical protein LIA77_08662 [Sarocladium implicatum]